MSLDEDFRLYMKAIRGILDMYPLLDEAKRQEIEATARISALFKKFNAYSLDKEE